MKLQSPFLGDNKQGWSCGQFRKTDDDKLKPCPFCGGTNLEMVNTHTAAYWVQCETCGAECGDPTPYGSRLMTKAFAMKIHRASFRRAAKAWNTRWQQ